MIVMSVLSSTKLECRLFGVSDKALVLPFWSPQSEKQTFKEKRDDWVCGVLGGVSLSSLIIVENARPTGSQSNRVSVSERWCCVQVVNPLLRPGSPPPPPFFEERVPESSLPSMFDVVDVSKVFDVRAHETQRTPFNTHYGVNVTQQRCYPLTSPTLTTNRKV